MLSNRLAVIQNILIEIKLVLFQDDLMNFQIILLILLSISIFTECVFATDSVRMSTPSVPPLIFYDEVSKNASGIIYNYWKANVDAKDELETIWLAPIPGDRSLELMNERKIDIAISAKNLSRFPESQVEYSSNPLYQASQIIIGRNKWPKKQAKTVLVDSSWLLPIELTSDPQFKVVKIFGANAPGRIIDLMERDRAWGFYSPVFWTGAIELLKRKKLDEFSPYTFKGNPKREFFVVVSKKVSPAVRTKVFSRVSLVDFQKLIDNYIFEACNKIDKKSCTEFVSKLKQD